MHSTDISPHQTMRARTFNAHSLRGFRKLFITLPQPTNAGLDGIFRAEFVGPGWLRATAPTALVLGGLGGWWGKQFDGAGRGMNIVHRGSTLAHTMPVALAVSHSLVDRRPCLKVTYPPSSPFPWPLAMDELRFLDDNTLLGLTIINAGPLRRVAFPFLLHKTTTDRTQISQMGR